MATIGPDGVAQWTTELTKKWEIAAQITDPTDRNNKLTDILNLSRHLHDRMSNPELATLYATLDQKFKELKRAEHTPKAQDQEPPAAAPSP